LEKGIAWNSYFKEIKDGGHDVTKHLPRKREILEGLDKGFVVLASVGAGFKPARTIPTDKSYHFTGKSSNPMGNFYNGKPRKGNVGASCYYPTLNRGIKGWWARLEKFIASY